YNLHLKHGAKFVPFAGYQMPIQYSEGIIDEHKYTRTNAGLFDVSHMGQLFIKGENELTDDLEKIFPLDLKNILLNQSKYSFLMNEDACIHDDLIITKVKGGYNIILNAACKNQDYEIIKKLLSNKYEMILNSDLSLVAIQGPKSADILKEIIIGPEKLNFMNGNWFKYKDESIYITRSGYTGEDGYEISISNKKVEELTENLLLKGVKLIGLGARDTLRLEAGLCLYGHDIDLETTPIEANLKWAISKKRLENGGFMGFDKIDSQIKLGTKRLRVGIAPEDRIIAREKTKIYNTDNEIIGEITSGTFGPSVQKPITLGYVQTKYSDLDTKVLLEVRGKKYPAKICKLPFYKKSYVKGAN
ncbi:MAG: glycine cleavage system aminomethyltransferase GcvT, partial [Candidatus Puniceispirillales bacterium]